MNFQFIPIALVPLQAQLAAFQREKVDLQAEVTRVKSEMIGQSTAIERLRAESSRAKRIIAEIEQRALSESRYSRAIWRRSRRT